MKTTILALPAALLTIGLVSCDNPADKTTDATIKETVAKTTDAAAGKKYVFATESKIGFTGSKVTARAKADSSPSPAISPSRMAFPSATTTRSSLI